MYNKENIYLYLIIIYVIWIFLFILGVQYVVKYKLWKPVHYLPITIITITYLIIICQIQILWLCFPTTHNRDPFQNSNNTFKLFDRSKVQTQFAGGDAPTKFNWDSPLSFGNGIGQNFYADDNNQWSNGDGNVCNRVNIIQLTELVSVSQQQLQDAEATYKNLSKLYNIIHGSILEDTTTLSNIIKDLQNANSNISSNNNKLSAS